MLAFVLGSQPAPTVREVAKTAWHAFKFAAKNAEAFVDGTPFKSAFSGLNKLIDITDVSKCCIPLPAFLRRVIGCYRQHGVDERLVTVYRTTSGDREQGIGAKAIAPRRRSNL
jgi:hypothetical protein